MERIEVRLDKYPTRGDLCTITELAKVTQVRGYIPDPKAEFDIALFKRLLSMGHTTPLEACSISFTVIGATRVFLSQITRHRHCSFTSGSQQYQDHAGFEYLQIPHLSVQLVDRYEAFMRMADELYVAIGDEVGRDWARYVIPGACRNTLWIGCNLRELLCILIPLRCCRRNTPETVHVMSLLLKELAAVGLGDILSCTGPECLTGGCRQGRMSCGRPLASWEDMLCHLP